jgi:catechol 2,3-dioxygenase-like lactoylglutathione lyase family enzyme
LEVTVSTTEVSGESAGGKPGPGDVDLRLEVVFVPVSDVDRAKAFYAKLGWREDADLGGGGFRVVQMTPPNSGTAIIFGEGLNRDAKAMLVVDDVAAAREQLAARGAGMAELFHGPGAGFQPAGSPGRQPGPDPDGGSYVSFSSFSDPDGNGWLLQEIKQRLPGRLWACEDGGAESVDGVAALLQETAEHHDAYEKSHPEHNWWDWYAAYFEARRNGATSERAVEAGGEHMADLKGPDYR